jgi:hypothetical protein
LIAVDVIARGDWFVEPLLVLVVIPFLAVISSVGAYMVSGIVARRAKRRQTLVRIAFWSIFFLLFTSLGAALTFPFWFSNRSIWLLDSSLSYVLWYRGGYDRSVPFPFISLCVWLLGVVFIASARARSWFFRT